MEFITLLLIIITNSITISALIKRKIEVAIPITVIAMTLIIYVCGLFDNLNVGVVIIKIISLVSTIYNIKTFIKSIKSKQIDKFLDILITPGLLVYWILFLLFIIINYNRMFEDYDEFNHWALIVKNMYMFNNFGTVENSIVAFNEYPPFTASFQYILLNIRGEYLEHLVIISQNILYLSIIIPICEKIEFKKNIKKLFLIIPGILFIPLILYEDFFINILVDGFLGILFAIALFTIYKNDADKMYRNIMLTLIITALALTKTTGLVLAILTILFILIKEKQKRIKTIILISIIPVILTSAWYIKINISDSKTVWDFKKIIQQEESSDNKLITEMFIEGLFQQDNNIGGKLSAVNKILLLVAYSVCVYKILQDDRKSYIYIIIATLISTAIFIFGIWWMYITIFEFDEAIILASFDRYVNTTLLTWVTLNTLILFDNIKLKLSNIYSFFVIGIALLPMDIVYTKYINHEQYILTQKIKRNYYYSNFRKYENIFTEQDKIYLISDSNMKNMLILKLYKYEMMTPNIANEEPIIYGTQEDFIEILLNQNYTYVYIYKVKDNFKEQYKEMFIDEIKNETLYKIEIDNNNILRLKTIE